MSKSALLLGATGLVGGHLLSLLTLRYERIVVLTRRELNKKDAVYEEHLIAFDKLKEYESLFNVDDVYCCLGTTIKKAGSQAAFRKVDYDYPLEAALCAKQAGAKRFLVVTAMGADPKSSFFYSRVKGELEASLEELQLPELHILKPSLILGDRKEERTAEQFAQQLSPLFSWMLIGPLKRYRPIQAKHIAIAMIEAANQQEPATHRYRSDQIEEWAAGYAD